MTGRRFATLDAALAAHRIPPENHTLIHRFSDALDVVAFYGLKGYIKAERRDGGPTLQINFGWTNGFRSRDEVVHALGDLLPLIGEQGIWPSTRGTGQWGVTHPVSRMGKGDRRKTAGLRRDYGICDTCFEKRAANRTCGCDA